MPSKRVTLADVARDAQVSQKTVSDVIHHRGRMKESTRERVEQSLQRLGYQTNLAARALRTGATKLIGLALPNFAQPFNGVFADEVSQYAWAKGYRVSIATYHGLSNGLHELIDHAYRFGTDGWIVLTDAPVPSNNNFLHQNFPVVLTGDYLAHNAVDCITFPNVEGAVAAVTWLTNNNCSTVGFIGAPKGLHNDDGTLNTQALASINTTDEGNAPLRFQGYMQVLKAKGLPLHGNIIGECERLDRIDGENATLRIIDSGSSFDALFCANDATALGAMSALIRRQIRIPDDVQIIGYDNTPDAEFSNPRLSTVDPSISQYAKLSVDRLIARIEGDTSAAHTYVTDFDIVHRDTTLIPQER